MNPVSPEFLPSRPRWVGLQIGLLPALLGVSLWCGVAAYKGHEQLAALERAQAERQLQYDQREQQRRQAASAQLLQQAQWATLDAAAAPWLTVRRFDLDGLLAAIESLNLPGVRLQGLRIQAEAATAQLSLDATDTEALNAVLLHLNGEPRGSPGESGALGRWQLDRLDRSKSSAPNEWALRATLSLKVGAAPTSVKH